MTGSLAADSLLDAHLLADFLQQFVDFLVGGQITDEQPLLFPLAISVDEFLRRGVEWHTHLPAGFDTENHST